MSRKTFSLFTGGKDSTASFLKASREGLNPDLLVTIVPDNSESYMFHTVNLWITSIHSLLYGKRHIFYRVRGLKEMEVEELRPLIKYLYEGGYEVATVGGLLSNYQRRRFESIFDEFGIEMYSPFWGVPQDEILYKYHEMGLRYMLTSVSAMGLGRNMLGWIARDLDDIEYLIEIASRHGFNPTGEGGEYESLVLYVEGMERSIAPKKHRIVWDGVSGYMEIMDVEFRDPRWIYEEGSRWEVSRRLEEGGR